MPPATGDYSEFEMAPAPLDDLFVDINWPEDLQDDFSGENHYTPSSGSNHGNSNYNESSSESTSPRVSTPRYFYIAIVLTLFRMNSMGRIYHWIIRR
jgi:hypothetical protein